MTIRSRLLLGSFTTLIGLAVVAPLAVIALVSFTSGATLTIPNIHHGLSVRWWTALAHDHVFREAFFRSALLAFAAAGVSLVVGAAAAYAVVRFAFRGRDLVASLVLLPIAIPEVVTALALLQFLARFRLNGSFLGLLGGHVIICLPYTFRILAVGFDGVDPTLEQVARGLGAGRLRIARRIIFPLMVPSVLGAATFAFLISFDAFTISLFLSGATFVTLPVQTYAYITDVDDPLVAAVSVCMIAVSIALVLLASVFVGSRRAIFDRSR
jgi:putative spermidine/putrescine transport system permease protein